MSREVSIAEDFKELMLRMRYNRFLGDWKNPNISYEEWKQKYEKELTHESC